jgi:diguanylate cyclase (GGDEF)-like protein
MKDDDVRNGSGLVDEPNAQEPDQWQDAQPKIRSGDELSDADRQLSDADRQLSEADQASADTDQRASDRDQAAADLEHSTKAQQTGAQEGAYEQSRDERTTGSSERLSGGRERAQTSRERHDVAARRSAPGNAQPGPVMVASLMEQLDQLRAQVAAGRLAAEAAKRERERLEAELESAHLDGLTGAYRREMGALAITHEIERMRRSGGELVLAFVDVDGLKAVNDRAGHAAGDRALQAVVRHIRGQLRPFDPIVRYGGDEFVCVLSGTHLAEAEHRFASIAAAIKGEAGLGISVGFASLTAGDTAEVLVERADAAMLQVKRRRH